MSVITISREFGSGGDLLAQSVARTLGYHLVDKAFVGAVLCEYGVAEFDVEYEKQPGFWESFDVERAVRRDIMVRMLNKVIRAAARHGNVVILGRSGYAILAGLADVLHVRLHAPVADRIETVRIEQNLSSEDAAAQVKEKDRIRTAFIESFYHVPWNALHGFDIAINTTRVPVEVATRWVIEAVGLRVPSPGDKPTTKQLEIDVVMAQAVAERLKCDSEHV